jgi:hypothetical protein
MNSIAAAKRRRAQPDNKPNPLQAKPPQPMPRAASTPSLANSAPGGAQPQRLNPQQYFAMIESRIAALEKDVVNVRPSLQIEVNTPEGKKKMDMSEYMADIDQKFMVLAEELSTLKDSMMKLQTFTMEVNQSLFNKVQPASIVSDMPPLPPHNNDIGLTYNPDIHDMNATQLLSPIQEESGSITPTDDLQATIENIKGEDETDITEDSIIGVSKKQKGKKK